MRLTDKMLNIIVNEIGNKSAYVIIMFLLLIVLIPSPLCETIIKYGVHLNQYDFIKYYIALLCQIEYIIKSIRQSNFSLSLRYCFTFSFQGIPDPPTNITASCDVSSIRVTWKAGFNGGENQTFRINIANTISNKTLFRDDIIDRRDNKNINVIRESIIPETLYRISLEASNVYGTTKSTEITNCTTKKSNLFISNL